MSYDYTRYRRCQYDSPRAAQPFRPYQPVPPRRVTCWDPLASRVEVLRPPSWPDPEPPYISHRLNPLDHRPRLRYQLVEYRDHSQDAWPRHLSGCAERGGHLSDRGDQETQLGFTCHPTHGTQRHARDVGLPSDSDDNDAWEARVPHRRRSRELSVQPRNPNTGMREGMREGQPWTIRGRGSHGSEMATDVTPAGTQRKPVHLDATKPMMRILMLGI